MLFYNRALKAQGAHLLETCVDFAVKENYDSGGCSSSSQEFSLEQLYTSGMSPGLVIAMQSLCYLYSSASMPKADAGVADS